MKNLLNTDSLKGVVFLILIFFSLISSAYMWDLPKKIYKRKVEKKIQTCSRSDTTTTKAAIYSE